MRILTRTLALLAGALAIGGVVTDAASASRDDQVLASPSIKGGGSIEGGRGGGRADGEYLCRQAPTVSEASVASCGGPWRYWTASIQDIHVPLTAIAATGWKFSGWTGCTSVSGRVCTLEGIARRGNMSYSPQAVFSDEPPEGVADLAADVGRDEGAYRVTWTAQEDGLMFHCSLDGAQSVPCRSGHEVEIAEGHHAVEVFAKDVNGNAGPVKTIRFTRVDTALTVAPLAATSRTGREFECSVDGAPFARCGSAEIGENASLSLPALADGRHTMRVRARYRDVVDPVPAAHTWIVDTTTPDTTVAPPTPAPDAIEPTPAIGASPVAPAILTAAPQRLSFKLRYATRKGRVTRFAVTELAPRADLRVSVKCPKRKRCPRGFAKWNALGTVELKRLVGKRLPAGTKITVRARRGQLTATQTITIKTLR